MTSIPNFYDDPEVAGAVDRVWECVDNYVKISGGTTHAKEVHTARVLAHHRNLIELAIEMLMLTVIRSQAKWEKE